MSWFIIFGMIGIKIPEPVGYNSEYMLVYFMIFMKCTQEMPKKFCQKLWRYCLYQMNLFFYRMNSVFKITSINCILTPVDKDINNFESEPSSFSSIFTFVVS